MRRTRVQTETGVGEAGRGRRGKGRRGKREVWGGVIGEEAERGR